MLEAIWFILPLILIPYCIYLSNKLKEKDEKKPYSPPDSSIINRAYTLLQNGKITLDDYNFIVWGRVPVNYGDSNSEGMKNPADMTSPPNPVSHDTMGGVPFTENQPASTNTGEIPNQVPNSTPNIAPQAIYNPVSTPMTYVPNNGQMSNTTPAYIPPVTNNNISNKPKKKISTVTLLTALGAAFIIIAGALFVISTWSILTTLPKILIMCSAVALFFGLSTFSEKKLKLKSTGFALFTIAVVLFPITIIGMAFLNLLGNSLSLPNGEHRYLVLAISALALALTSMLGAKKYQNKHYAFTVMVSLTVSYLFLIFDFDFANSTQNLLMALYAIAVTAICEFLNQNKLKAYKDIAVKFSNCNTILISIFSLFIYQKGVLSAISLIVIGSLFLNKRFTNEKNASGVIPFIIFLIAGLYRIYTPIKMSDYSLLISTAIITVIMLSELGLFSDNTRKLMRICSIILSIVAFTIGFVILPINLELNNVENLISIILITLCVTWAYFRTKNKFIARYHSLVVLLLILSFSSNIFRFQSGFYLLSSILVFAAWLGYYITKKMRTEVSDFAYLISSLVLMLLHVEVNDNYLILIPAVLFGVIATTLAFDKTKSVVYSILKYAYPLSILAFFSLISGFLFSFNIKNIDYIIIISYFAFVSIFAIVLSFKRDDTFKKQLFGFDITILFFGFFFLIDWYNKLGYTTALGILILTYGLVRYALVSWEKPNIKKLFAFVSVAYSLISTVAIISQSTVGKENSDATLFILSIVCLVEFLLLSVGRYAKLAPKHINNFNFPVKIAIAVIPIITYLNSEPMTLLFWTSCIMLAISYVSLSLTKWNPLAIIPLLCEFSILNNVLKSQDVNDNIYIAAIILAQIFLSLIGRLRYKQISTIDKNQESKYDCLTIAGGIGILYIFNHTLSVSATFLSLTIFLTGFYYKRLKAKNADRTILTITLSSLCFCLATQKLVDIPSIISLEISLLPFFALAVALRFIWREFKNSADLASFSVVLISMISLMFDAIATHKITDALIFIGMSVVLILISMAIKRKKWLLMSLALTIFTTIYMMKPFFNRISWWVYLLAIGVILIVIAAFREYAKNHSDNVITKLKEKTSDFYQDWNW